MSIEDIQKRNRRVELDKAWETSYTRRAIISVLTYGVIVVFLFNIQAPRPFLNAIVPTIGYILSTLTMPLFKKWWMRSR